MYIRSKSSIELMNTYAEVLAELNKCKIFSDDIFFGLTCQEEGSKKMHPRKPEKISGFLLFSPFFSLFQKSKNNADKKMQNAF